VDVPVTYDELALGEKIVVPAPNGTRVKVRIPAGTQPNATLSVPGLGAPVTKSKRGAGVSGGAAGSANGRDEGSTSPAGSDGASGASSANRKTGGASQNGAAGKTGDDTPRGDLKIKLKLVVPKVLNDEQKEALRSFGQASTALKEEVRKWD
jgi:DnaJ-class molecular chaperone